MIDIIITDFPFPPSVNNYLMPVFGGTKINKKGKHYNHGRLVKTQSHIDYSVACDVWAARYKSGLKDLCESIRKRRDELESSGRVFALDVTAYLVFNREYVLTKSNIPKKVDADNFSKALQDNLFRILQLDDKYSFSPTIEKVIGSTSSKNYVVLSIKEKSPENVSSLAIRLGIKIQ